MATPRFSFISSNHFLLSHHLNQPVPSFFLATISSTVLTYASLWQWFWRHGLVLACLISFQQTDLVVNIWPSRSGVSISSLPWLGLQPSRDLGLQVWGPRIVSTTWWPQLLLGADGLLPLALLSVDGLSVMTRSTLLLEAFVSGLSDASGKVVWSLATTFALPVAIDG